MGYVARHWRGELPLALSFWVNNLLLLVPLGLAIGMLMAWIVGWGQSLQAASVALLVGGALLALLSVWSLVGCWRSASAHRADGGSALWSGLAKLVLGLGALGNLGTLARWKPSRAPGARLRCAPAMNTSVQALAQSALARVARPRARTCAAMVWAS